MAEFTTKFPAPPLRTPFATPHPTSGMLKAHPIWEKWLQQIPGKLDAPASGAVPVNVHSPGTIHQVAHDDNFVYVCIGPNRWKRAQLVDF